MPANPVRAAALLSGLALAFMLLVCAPFLVMRTEVPTLLLLVGRWLPAVASLLVLRLVRHEGGVVSWWGLRPGGWRRLLAGIGAALAVSLVVGLVPYAIGRATGLVAGATLPGPLELAGIALVTTVVASLSTLGEEVAWRGHLQKLLSGWGFWGASLAIGAVWVLWHVPLHATYVVAGTMSMSVAAATTVALIGSAPLWSALVVRFGSVWPAVVAHAFPLTATAFAGDLGALEAGRLWAYVGLSILVSGAAAVLIAPRGRTVEG